MSNQYEIVSERQEMAETLLKGLNQELRSRGLEQEINEVKLTPEKVKKHENKSCGSLGKLMKISYLYSRKKIV